MHFGSLYTIFVYEYQQWLIFNEFIPNCMKKQYPFTLFTFLLCTSLYATPLRAETTSLLNKDKLPQQESFEANRIYSRLDEIKAMEKSKLSALEKKQLRHEVKSLKSNLATLNGGVYLSVGAIIVIILLLLLLL